MPVPLWVEGPGARVCAAPGAECWEQSGCLRSKHVVTSWLCYSMLRNSASGPEIGLPGRILAGLQPGKDRIRHSGRPSAGWRADFGAFPAAVRPSSGPEGRFTARKHCCVTWSMWLPVWIGLMGGFVFSVLVVEEKIVPKRH